MPNEYGGGWGFTPGWLQNTAKKAQPTPHELRMIEVCKEYMRHDPEADITRPLCVRSLCHRLEGHRGRCV